MTASVISSLEISWGASANPTPQDITVPSDCTAVYMLSSYYRNASGAGLSSATLEGVSVDEVFGITTTPVTVATSVAAWYNPGTGANQTLDISWSAAADDPGPSCVIVFVKDGDTTGWRDADAEANQTTTATSVTLTTVSDDLVIKFDRIDNSSPSLSSGWTNIVAGTENSDGYRASSIVATTTTQVCDSEDESYSGIVAISIPPAAGSDTEITTNAPDALILTEYAATVANDVNVTTGTPDALVLTEYQATIDVSVDVNVTTNSPDALTLTEYAATVANDVNISVGVDALTLTEYQATIVKNINVTAGVDALTLTEYAATIANDINVTAGVDALTLTTYPVSLGQDTNDSVGVDALTLTEYSATISKDVDVATGTPDALILTEYAATIANDVNIAAGIDALILTEYQATISVTSTISSWGDSWASSWGDSWGWQATVTPPDPDEKPNPVITALGSISSIGTLSGIGRNLITTAAGSIECSGFMSAAGVVVGDGSSLFYAYGSVNVTGTLSQAYLHKVTCITPTATMTWFGDTMSAGFTDPNLFFSSASVVFSGSLDVSSIYARGLSTAMIGQLSAYGRKLPIGTGSWESQLADVSIRGFAGPGTIDGKKKAIINSAYGSVEIYNNSLGGFYTIGQSGDLKEAFGLINVFNQMSAIGEKDAIKFATGTITV